MTPLGPGPRPYRRKPFQAPTLDELLANSQDEGECRIWTGKRLPKGYGVIRRQSSNVTYHWLAHRVAYELAYGSIPEGHEIHHRCERKECIKPEHLEAVTRRQHKAVIHPAKRDAKGRFT